MKGVYCLVIGLNAGAELAVGSLGRIRFLPGVYVYVGSAMSGVEQRVRRHKSADKKRRWHIDYLLARAEVIATIALPTDRKDVECSLASAVSACEGATCPVEGFGSSDCRCRSHLFFFGEADPEPVIEELNMRLSSLDCIYPRSQESPRLIGGPTSKGPSPGSVRQ